MQKEGIQRVTFHHTDCMLQAKAEGGIQTSEHVSPSSSKFFLP
jgi:hypothetical protein